jgi:hypothetical protein
MAQHTVLLACKHNQETNLAQHPVLGLVAHDIGKPPGVLAKGLVRGVGKQGRTRL